MDQRSNLRPIFVTATGTGIGKTYASVLLLKQLHEMGVKATPFKPIETGVEHLPVDALLLQQTAEELGNSIELSAICPINYTLPAAPDIARGDEKIDWDKIDSAYEACQQNGDIVVIEGAGGAFSPIENDLFNIDLAKRFNAKTLLVCHDRLGLIHDLITTMEMIRSKGIDPVWAINIRDDDFEKISKPYLIKCFGSLLSLQLDMQTIAEKLTN